MTTNAPAAVRQSAESFPAVEIIGGKYEPRARVLEARYFAARKRLEATLTQMTDELFVADACDYARVERNAKKLTRLIRAHRDAAERFNNFVARSLAEIDAKVARKAA